MEGSTTDIVSMPEGVISYILSLTTPKDTGRSAVVASIFKLAGEADNVWEKFLPSDYQEIISRSDCSIEFSSKKELYLRLCDPLLVDGGTKSFWLDKSSGKKCYMISARQLDICWADTIHDYWVWDSIPESRFSEVAVLEYVWWLNIEGKVNACILSPETTYVVYFVVRFAEHWEGLGSRPTELRVQIGDQVSTSIGLLSLDYSERFTWDAVEGEVQLLCNRHDGWMEIEVASFYNKDGDDGKVLISVRNVQATYKIGLIIEGMEVRPRVVD